MVEIVSPVCETPNQVVSHIWDALHHISQIGKDHGFRIGILGTHPFARKEETHITAKERYLKLLEELQILLRQFLIYGLHIHIGFPDKEMAVKGYNSAINYLPLFLGLSTSSPFFYGEHTGLHSYRVKIFEQLPRAGIPEYFDSYSQFEELYTQLYQGGFIQSIKDIWWDVRIHPDLGTVELRVCDANPEVDRVELIISLFLGIVFNAQQEETPKFFEQVLKQNKWNATRYSLEGKFLDRDGVVSIKEKIHQLIHKFDKKGIWTELKIQDRITDLLQVLDRKPVSQKMVDIYMETKDLRNVEEIGLVK